MPTPSPPRPWTREDIPTTQTMSGYLSMIRAVRNFLPGGTRAPEVPEDMNSLTYQKANDIETILMEADQAVTNLENSWFVSGEIDAGGF